MIKSWKAKNSGSRLWVALFVMPIAMMMLPRVSRADLSKQQQEKIEKSVTLVLVYSERNVSEGWGSGLVVRYPNGKSDCIYILTDAHVVRAGSDYCKAPALPASQIKIRLNPKWYNKLTLPVSRVVLYSPFEKNDLALLEVKKSSFLKWLHKVPPSLNLYTSVPNVNSTVTHFGFPTKKGSNPHASLLNSVHVSHGKVYTLEFVKTLGDPTSICPNASHNNNYFWLAPGVWTGGSGGGVFDDKGNWIGIADVAVPLDKATGTLKGKVATGVTRPNIIAQFLDQKPQNSGTSLQKIVNYPDGKHYEGGWSNGKMNGHGTLTFPNGERYVGEFRDGKRSGYGVDTWPDGDIYKGQWRNDMMNGQGIYTQRNGSRYDGEWLNNRQANHAKTAGSSSMERVSQSNLKQVALGIFMYTQDYDEKYPPMVAARTAKNIREVPSSQITARSSVFTRLQPYLKSTQICLQPSTHHPYIPNYKISRHSTNHVKHPASTFLFYEDAPDDAGMRNVAYADGHVKAITEAEFQRERKAQGISVSGYP